MMRTTEAEIEVTQRSGDIVNTEDDGCILVQK